MMIFKQITEVLDGRKTQTRRLVREGENGLSSPYLLKKVNGQTVRLLNSVFDGTRRRFYVGQRLPIIPKRGQPAIRVDGVIQYVEVAMIWQERLQEMTPNDAICEGLWERMLQPDFRKACWTTSVLEPSEDCYSNPVGAYARLWDSINTRKGTRWANNPLVWVISFRRWHGE